MDRVLLSTLGTPEKVGTYMALIARAMAGEYIDKQWGILFGERNSGKGLLQFLNELCFGPYVNTINANAFLLQQFAASDAAKALSFIVDCEYSRQTYTNEVKCDKSSRFVKLDGNLLKSFQSGGDLMSARKNRMDEQSIRIGSKLLMNLNDIPTVSPPDAMSTMLLLKFPHKFVDAVTLSESPLPFYRLRDDSLKSEYLRRPEVLSAFTWLVIDAYLGHPVDPCREVLADTSQYLEDIGEDHCGSLRNLVQVTGRREDVVPAKLLAVIAKDAEMSVTKLRDRLRQMGAWYDKNCHVDGVSHGRGYMGVRRLADDMGDF
jgi:hypothetical protein